MASRADTSGNPPDAADEPLRLGLEHLYQTFPYAERLKRDPLRCVLRYPESCDQEVAGLICALLAYGRVELFLPRLDYLLNKMDDRGGPRVFVEQFRPEREGWLEAFQYRMTTGRELRILLMGVQRLVHRYGSLEDAFWVHFRPEQLDIGSALEAWVGELSPPVGECSRAFRHLLSDPGRGSACKRLMLYLRWMVRRQAGMDPGPWRRIPASHLLVPLDTHTLRLWRNLGLTRAELATQKVAREITARLRRWDPVDPVRYDFAVCHLGMSGGCPLKREEVRCRACMLKMSCCWGRALQG